LTLGRKYVILYYMNRQDITKIVKFCCKKLRLPIPKINIIDEGMWVGTFRFTERGTIELDFFADRIAKTTKEWAYESVWKFLDYTPTKKWEYGFLIIAHELSHYMQYSRHYCWLSKYMREVEKYMNSYKRFSLKKYQNLKAEANANKVALLLLKRAKKEGFKI